MSYKWLLRDEARGTVYQLTNDPKGWEAISKKLYRSDRYHGIFMQPTLKELSFLKGDGFEFIDSVYTLDGINANISITHKKLSGNGIYIDNFKAKLNLSNYTKTDIGIRLNLEQSDLYQKILAREENSVNLLGNVSIGEETISAISPNSITLPSIAINMKSEWLITDDGRPNIDGPGVGIANSSFGGILIDNDLLIRKELDESVPGIASIDLALPPVPFSSSLAEPVFTFLVSDFLGQTENFYFTWDYRGYISASVTFFPVGSTYRHTGFARCMLAYGPDNSSASQTELFRLDWNNSVGGYATDFNEQGTVGIPLTTGDKVWLYWQFDNKLVLHSGAAFGSVGTAFGLGYTLKASTLEVNSTVPPSTCSVVLAHEAFNQVVDCIADSDNNFESTFYGRTDSTKVTYPSNGKGAFVAISDGKTIRQFDKGIFASLKELFDTFNTLHNIGLGIQNGKVRVEPKEYFYNPNHKLCTLAFVDDYTIKAAPNYYYNKAILGYEKWESEFIGGIEEPCSKHEYSTKVNSVKGVYNAISPFLASSYAIEATRRKNKNVAPTDDWRFDESRFIFSLLSNYDVERYNDSFSSGSGIISLNTLYNLRYTPKRILLAHMANITAGLQQIHGNIKFVKGEGNTSFQAAMNIDNTQGDYNGAVLAEDDEIAWDDTNAANYMPLWVPEIYEFSYPLSDDQMNAIEAYPYGFIEFYKTPNEIFSGYILEAENNLIGGKTQFKLLKRYGGNNHS